MNYFAHALPWLGEPYLVAGTAVPDWLAVCDRGVRLRRKTIEPWLDDPDPVQAGVARGAAQHLADDARFHETRAFVETSLALTMLVRDFLDGERGFRPSLLGHLLVEVLLDAQLVAHYPAELRRYYADLEQIDPGFVQRVVNRMGRRPTERLAPFIRLFLAERILFDYGEDVRLLARLNQVMRRVRCEPLPPAFVRPLADARQMVDARRSELLQPVPAAVFADHRLDQGEPPCDSE